ncbi:uncharacterized protein LOC123561450 [Mercenaria mercenaria]|uniref:uncharacterized protein LOC123561450 n=1 Tax=Mercenaria mercenaria TaxID=6596 RepID=UPI00234EC80F|nr:uncharacterized protein LOC123561450 [Mercenaria mercenaria]
MEEKNQPQFCHLGILHAVIIIIATLVWYLHRKLRRNSAPNSVRSRKSGWEISKNLQFSEIGVNFNKWRRPVSIWGRDDEDLKLCQEFRSIDIGKKEWDRATRTVDAVLSMLLCEMQKIARREYKDLVIEKYVKQGSSREGLKVNKADEFDVLLLFYITGMHLEIKHLTDANDFILPEFGRLVVADDIRNPWLNNYIVIDEVLGKYCLNSRKLHEKLFISIIQRAAHELQQTVVKESKDDSFRFTIEKFRKNPPSVNIQIELSHKDENCPYDEHLTEIKASNYGFTPESARIPIFFRTLIDVDIVPGIQLRTEQVPNPTDWDGTMECPRYAVFRWVEQNQPAAAYYKYAPEIRWRVCTSGYEKHVVDVTRGSKEQSYIVTALRIMKSEFQGLRGLLEPPQLVTVLRSYYLKHIAFYCILYLTVINKVGLLGVKQALAYYLDFLQVVLEEKRLPHFFHDNEFIVYMFPTYEMSRNTLRYDLFTGKPKEFLEQAELSFKRLRLKQKLCEDASTFPEYAKIFRRYIQAGKYYTGPCRPHKIV